MISSEGVTGVPEAACAEQALFSLWIVYLLPGNLKARWMEITSAAKLLHPISSLPSLTEVTLVTFSSFPVFMNFCDSGARPLQSPPFTSNSLAFSRHPGSSAASLILSLWVLGRWVRRVHPSSLFPGKPVSQQACLCSYPTASFSVAQSEDRAPAASAALQQDVTATEIPISPFSLPAALCFGCRPESQAYLYLSF